MRSKVKLQAVILSLPALVYFFIFVLYPLFLNVYYSFYNFTTEGMIFTGLRNYYLIFKTPYFNKLVYNTILYTLLVPVIDVLLAIPLASVLRNIKNKALLPTIMIPSFIPQVTAATLWLFLLSPTHGLAYYFKIGDIFYSPLSIVLIDVWASLPLSTLIIFSSMKSIPQNLDEASKMDGIIGLRKLMLVDIPYIKSSIISAFVLMLMYGSFTFDPIYVLSSKSSAFGINDLSYFAYSNYINGSTGFAAVIIIIVSILSTIFTLIFVRITLSKQRNKNFKLLNFGKKIFPNVSMPRIGNFVIFFIYIVFLIGPIIFLFLTSFKNLKEILASPPVIIPYIFVITHYSQTISQGMPYIVSSLIASLVSSLFVIILAIPIAYATSRFKLGGLKIIGFVLFIYSLPTIIFLIPISKIMLFLGLYNEIPSLIITYPIFILPLAIWLLYNFYYNFPKHIDEAASMDGMSLYKSMWKIITPLSTDGILVSFLYSFVLSWGALIFPLALSYSPFNLNIRYPEGAQTFTIFIASSVGHEAINYGLLAASSVISILPAIILTIIMRNRLENIWRTGGQTK
ncbi:ABC transporter permease [Caldiplasma sukawensis]